MAFLLLNFAENSESGRNYERDFYNKPLKKQYEALSLRYSQLKQFEYERLIQVCFLVGSEKKYYISMPNFIRGDSLGSNKFLNNIVIRSPRDGFSEYVLPNGLEVILIGDIKMDPYGEFIVKGIELIDSAIFKQGEIEIEVTAKCAFSKKTLPNSSDGNLKTVPDYGYDFKFYANTSLLTRDFMGNMYTNTNSYTVSDPINMRKIYDNWKKYIEFRKYFLEEQGKEKLPFDSCNAIKCYIIPQREYRNNPDEYDDFILDDLDRIRKEEQVIVTKKFDNSELFELVRITIEKNKKELFENTVKGKGEKPVFEQELNRFTRSDITLQNEDGRKQINIDERYRFFSKEIPPDYSNIESDFARKLDDAYNEIEGRFAAELRQKVAEYIQSRTVELENKAKTRLSEYKAELDSRLEQDLAENNDEEIRRDYAAQIKQIEETIQKQIINMEKEYKDNIDSINNKKEKDPDNITIKELEQQRNTERKIFIEDLERQKNLISLSALYEARNNRLVSKKEAELKAEMEAGFFRKLKQKILRFLGINTEELPNEAKAGLSEYKSGLDSRLEQDVAENNDEVVRSDYAAQIKQIDETVQEQTANMEKGFKDKIDSIKGKYEKDPYEEAIKELKQQCDAKHKVFIVELEQNKKSVSLRALYGTRNNKLGLKKEAELKVETEAELRRNQKEKTLEIQTGQKPQIRDEKEKAKQENLDALNAEKKELEKNKTILCYYIYFKLQPDDTVDKINEDIKKFVPKYFKFDKRAEKAKIDRQEKSLNNLFGGYVKNPFLATYLFAPRELGNISTDILELEYFSQRLNDKQKEAVKKAVASESIFLLQGPPGTGKTEVITEIAAQLVKKGKRILISSETHKAIDNVFERLPKIPEIRPLRLIPSESKKDPSPYSTEHLVDNFYINIRDSIEKTVEKYVHFNEDKEKFEEKYKLLHLEHEKLTREKSQIASVHIMLEKIKRERDGIDQKLDVEKSKLSLLSEEKEKLFSRINKIKHLNLSEDDEYEKKLKEEFLILLKPYPMLNQDFSTLSLINKSNITEITEEIALLSGNPELTSLEAGRNKLRTQMQSLRDPDTEEPIVGMEAEFETLKKRLIALSSKIRALDNDQKPDISELRIVKIMNSETLDQSTLASLPNVIMEIKNKLVDLINTSMNDVGAECDQKAVEYNAQKGIVDELNNQIRGKDKELQAEKDKSGYEDYHLSESEFKLKISGFFKRFEIMKPYEDIAAALDIIKDEWNELESNYAARENENKEKIPIYKRISKFLHELDKDGSIETDRRKYTKKLFEKANIFGLTCTSRENFKADALEAFQKYSLDGLNVKEQGIDTVIIDEVSKSSLLDLLIPILYGKTVILVGDHRQLPPMYDLRHMHKEDFEGLDQEIINFDKNEEFTKLYEKCFFKTLFENVSDRLRVMLTKQYRCHEDIMRVFNHFYIDSRGRGSLELGNINQNNQKEHGLLVKNKNEKSIIVPDKHIYFIDCADSYENFGDSTSATNEKEAQVIAHLARKIDDAYGRLNNKFIVDKDRDIDERMSMGIICTYGDQVKLIKRRLPKNTLKNLCERAEERFITSTVDDFQGDERDIIFVSMVRHPRNKKSWPTAAEFLKKFERINVAFSRARRLLIIVGAKDFLSETTINLPDMGGNRALDNNAYRVYYEIIQTINTHGMVHRAADIIGEGK